MQSLYAHTLSHANHLRNEADAQFFEDREGERLAFERMAEEKYAEFQEQIENYSEVEVERTARRVDELGEKAGEKTATIDEERADVKREREELRLERAELRLEKEELRRDKQAFRADREEFRRLNRALQREWGELQAPRRNAKRTRGLDATSTRAGSAPI